MQTLFFPLVAALALLAGCGQTATNGTGTGKESTADAAESDTGPDIVDVPDESADANGAAADVDDGSEVDDSEGASNRLDGPAGLANTSR